MSALYFGSYAVLLTDQSWYVAWPICLLMGIAQAGLGFCVAHDALHGAFSTRQGVNGALGLIFEALGGNGHAWRRTHNGAHHGLPNVSGHDEDIDVTPLIRLSPHSPRRWIHKYQHLYAFGLYGLSTLNWAIAKDYAWFLREHRKQRHSMQAWARLVFGKLAFYAAMAAPFLVLQAPVYQVLVGLLTVHLTAGLILGLVFQLAHGVEGVAHAPASEAASARAQWAAHQLRTTSNFRVENRLGAAFIGGLNYQVEHHLFPRVSHVHYRGISPIVERTAVEHGLPYNQFPSFGQALASHGRMLRRLGRPKPILGSDDKARSAQTHLLAAGSS